MRILENGDIIFPKRGSPPRTPDGYDADKNDPYLFHPVWEDCAHRYSRQYLCQSGLVKSRPACHQIGSDITFAICDACTLPKV